MVTRRDFHKGLLGLALASLAAPRAMANFGVNPPVTYLNRLTFGATTESLAEFERLGLDGWLENQMAMPESDAALEARIAAARLLIEYEAGESDTGETWEAVEEMRHLTMLGAPATDMVKFMDFDLPMDFAERERPGNEVIAASFIRATHAQGQLREVMTQFWHNHFNANALKDVETSVFFPEYDRIMRRHALGNFRTLLGEVAQSPSMLYYLNNASSRASPANENYARELLELHTMGAANYLNDKYDNWHEVPGAEDGLAVGYIDQDVYEVARAFTGWTVGDGDWLDDSADKPKTGAFYYATLWHDPYQKRFLGVEFEANAAPLSDGNKVLDILAAHPATARFVTEKIILRLGLEDVNDAFKAEIAEVFSNAVEDEDQIAQVVRAIVLSAEFATLGGGKLRTPFEFLIALYRATGTQVVEPQYDLYWQLERAGWTQHQVHPPTGHSDHSIDWANTRALNSMVNLALYAHDGWLDGVNFNPKVAVKTWGEYAEHWVDALQAQPEVVKAFLKGMEVSHGDSLPFEDDDYLLWGANNAIALAALTPQFMFR
jgi:uncharacterized protein (DUF1800 family)